MPSVWRTSIATLNPSDQQALHAKWKLLLQQKASSSQVTFNCMLGMEWVGKSNIILYS